MGKLFEKINNTAKQETEYQYQRTLNISNEIDGETVNKRTNLSFNNLNIWDSVNPFASVPKFELSASFTVNLLTEKRMNANQYLSASSCCFTYQIYEHMCSM